MPGEKKCDRCGQPSPQFVLVENFAEGDEGQESLGLSKLCLRCEPSVAREALTNAVLRLKPEVETVLFAADEQHVFIGPVERDGEQIVERYELSTEARQFLAGEFPLESLPSDFSMLLRAPQGGDS